MPPPPLASPLPFAVNRNVWEEARQLGTSLLEGDSTDTRKGQVSPGVSIYAVLNMVLLWDKKKPLDHT